MLLLGWPASERSEAGFLIMAAIDEFIEGLLEIEPEIPQTFTWPAPPLAGGQDYACFASRATKGGKLEHFGFGIDEDLVIIVRASLFGEGPFPERGQTVEFAEITYRIDKVLTAPASSFLRLACVNASQGA
jgi:hypothetical protein